MSTEERRTPGATRQPFDAVVEVGGALGPTFEAQAVNVSEEGIQLRTAYLPEAGQALTCRFDAGSGRSVLASGEVAWTHGSDDGGEFGVRFTDVDPESVEALKTVCGVADPAAVVSPGSRVRLHIDGLASPMRAKIRDSLPSAVTVGSDLGFLQMGKPLELEDASSGQKRPACVDRVDVVVDPTSQVPQLVVTLRYADGAASVAVQEEAPRSRAGAPAKPAVPTPVNDASDEAIAIEMKGAVARGMAEVGPAVTRWLERAGTTVKLLAARSAHSGSGDPSSAGRRTTAPPPTGGLHTLGRRVVRGEPSPSQPDPAELQAGARMQRQRAAVAVGVIVCAVAGGLLLKKGHHDVNGGPSAAASVAPPPSATAPVPAEPAPLPAPTNQVAVTPPAPDLNATPADPADATKAAGRKHVQVTPFANGPVHHGNVLRLKMDGVIDSIEGAQQPMGFIVKIPARKSLEAAAPLAARDGRISAIRVSNDTAGAELTVAFKDGVPNYRVSAKGDTLVIALAAPGAVGDAPTPAKDEKPARVAKRTKHHTP